jgi:acyl carrier protein
MGPSGTWETPEAALVDRIARLVGQRMNLDIPAADTDLFESGVLDSFALVELLVLLEQEFGVKVSIDDLELDNFGSIVRIASWVAAHRDADAALEA